MSDSLDILIKNEEAKALKLAEKYKMQPRQTPKRRIR